MGFDSDYCWNIREVDPPTAKPTDFERYGLSKSEQAAGISLHAQFDDRRNPINPEKGNYINVTYRPNFTFLGSDNNWQSLLLDVRKFLPFPAGTHNVLAFWNYDWFTVGSGTPPYLFLPTTGWEAYTNTARGYIQ